MVNGFVFGSLVVFGFQWQRTFYKHRQMFALVRISNSYVFLIIKRYFGMTLSRKDHAFLCFHPSAALFFFFFF